MKYICLLAITSLLFSGCRTSMPEEKIDHIILAVNNLDSGMRQFEQLTGVKPVIGGIHPNSFTQNALVALDGERYIEILAPRIDYDSIPEWIQKLDRLTPYGWAVTTREVLRTQEKLGKIGLAVTEPKSGSRAKPDGTMLGWTIFNLPGKKSDVYPFFIQWSEGSVHPSQSSPTGCSLAVFAITASDVKSLGDLNQQLKLNLHVAEGPENIKLQLATPKGMVIFTGLANP